MNSQKKKKKKITEKNYTNNNWKIGGRRFQSSSETETSFASFTSAAESLP
jgi:hypothetical protein